MLFLGISISVQIGFYPRLGIASSIILMLPVIAAAWYFGIWEAILVLIVGMGVNALAGYINSNGSWSAFPWDVNLAGGLGAIVAATLIVRIRTLLRKQQQEIIERKNAEEERRIYADFLTLLNDIIHASLEAKDLQTLLELLADRTGELFSADDCFITIWNEITQTTLPTAAYGSMSRSYSEVPALPGQRTLTSSTLEAGHALVVEDTANTPYVDQDVAVPFPELRTALGLPLISGDRKLGALILGFHHKRTFSSEEIEQGELAARQISLAMMKVILLEEARQRVGELAGLHAIAQTFTPQGDTRRTFSQLTMIVANLIGAKKCMVALQDPGGNEIRGQASAHGLADEQVDSFHYLAAQESDIWGFSRKNIFRANSLEELPGDVSAQAESCGMENALVAPIWNTDRKITGILLVANKAGDFGDEDIRLLEILAGQVAVVVENMRLLAAERRRAKELSVLNKISIAATEADGEDELIEQVTQLIGEQLYPDNFGVMLLDGKKDDLYLHSSYRMGERESLIRIPVGMGITGSVARSGKTRCISDVRVDPDYINADERVLSELCAPLKVGERVIGVINAESSRVGAFTKEDENLMGILAGQLAIAIQRLRTADAEYSQTTMLMRSNALIRILAQVGARAAAAPDPAGVMKTLGEELSKIGLTCLVALPKDEQHMSIAYSSIPKRVMDLFERVSKRPVSEFLFPSEQMLDPSRQDYRPQLVSDPLAAASKILVGFSSQAVEKMMRPIGVAENVPMCHLPLVSEGKLQGVLWMWGEGLRESDLPTISIFASQVAIALQNSRLLAEVQRMAITDEGTGIFNRRHFFELAEQEFSRARRYKHSLTAIIVDVDEFKRFNDHYGHVIGDLVLRQVAQALKNNLRDGDILGRYGGEEFSILLPFTNLEIARQVADRLCKRVAAAEVKTGKNRLSVTVSVGLAELQPETETLLGLVELADQAMYAAKQEGGNQVHTR